MGIDQVVYLGRMILEEIILLTGPVLGVAIIVSVLVNLVQVLTSLQDSTISTVTRLIATGTAVFLAMPWMWRHLAHLTITIFSNFQVYMQ